LKVEHPEFDPFRVDLISCLIDSFASLLRLLLANTCYLFSLLGKAYVRAKAASSLLRVRDILAMASAAHP
jgi:hypothetical protein